MDFNKDIKTKLCSIIERYMKENPNEVSDFKKQQEGVRELAKDIDFEVPDSDMLVRRLNEWPTTLYFMIKGNITDDEWLHFQESEMQCWLGNKYPIFKISEGRTL